MTKVSLEFLRAAPLNGGKLYVNYEELIDLLESYEDRVDNNAEVIKTTCKAIRQDLKERKKSINI